MTTTNINTGVNSLSAEPTRVKAYGDAEMMKITNELSRKGFKRVQNAYWVEHWSDGKNTVIVERCDENEKPATITTEKSTFAITLTYSQKPLKSSAVIWTYLKTVRKRVM